MRPIGTFVQVIYFFKKPFENWTRNSPELVGEVKIYTDYNLPIVEIRTAFNEWNDEIVLWYKLKAALLITDSSDKTIEVLATMSAKNSDDAFNIECLIREKLITFIWKKYPQSLPFSHIKNNNLNDV